MRRTLVEFEVTMEQLAKMFSGSNELTVRSWEKRWLDNVVENLRTVTTPRPLKQLLTNVNTHVALCCGAGPSLRKLKKRAPLIPPEWGVIACDYSLLAVLEVGIKPLFVVTMDGHQETEPAVLEGFARLAKEHPDVPVIADIVSCPSVVEQLTNPYFFRSMGEHSNTLNRYVMQQCPQIDQIGHGGNVGSVACILAKFWSFARHVVLIGYDSAMREGTYKENYWNGKNGDDDKQYVEVCDVYGRPIMTMGNLHNYKWWLDHFCYMNNDVEWINANDGGFLGVCGPDRNYNHYTYLPLEKAVEHLKDHSIDD
jgi:hypothetical protein